jgi:hypothetical protein
MSTSKKTEKDPTKARAGGVHGLRKRSKCLEQIGAFDPLSSWRTLRALQFSSHDVTSMRAVLAKTSLFGQPKWAAAASGDATAAVAVAVSFIPVDEITPSLDLAMTALITCAIEGDPGAATVASNMLRHLPGVSPHHRQIATSWFVSNLAACVPSKRNAVMTEAASSTNVAEEIGPSECEAMAPKAFELWRTIPAGAFDESRRLAVIGYVAEFLTGINIKAWKAAISGDAACAIRIAREIAIPEDEFTYPVEARLTLLLYCALKGSAEAALALSSLLREMPLDETVKNRLAASWLVRSRHTDQFGELDVTPRRSHLSLVPQIFGNREDKS